jgi:hypothetical protein
MKTSCLSRSTAVVLALQGSFALHGADDPQPPSNRPDPSALRERAKKLSPEERQKMIREFREKHGLVGTNRPEWDKRREELRKLPPAEREARLKEMRQEIQEGKRQFKLLAPEDRDAKRREMKQRIDAQVSALQKQKAEGALTEGETRRLERMEQMSMRLGRGDGENPKKRGLPKEPLPSETEVLPLPKPNPKE